MSIENKHTEDCPAVKETEESIEVVLQPREKDIGNFSVRRCLPSHHRRMVGPWIFFDEMGPAKLSPQQALNVRPHPHINLATVTYLFEGEILHRDSLGNHQTIEPGDINLMVAGKGITHSERERPERKTKERNLHGLQLWLALPKESEEIDPDFIHYPKEDIPSVEVKGVPVRLMMGKAYGMESPVKTFAHTLYLEARLKEGQTLALPKEEQLALYVLKGKISVKGESISEHSMVVFKDNAEVKFGAQEETLIACIGGEKFDKRQIFWNFVSSRPERIQQAKEDWKNGEFPKVVGDEDDFIPLPGEGV